MAISVSNERGGDVKQQEFDYEIEQVELFIIKTIFATVLLAGFMGVAIIGVSLAAKVIVGG